MNEAGIKLNEPVQGSKSTLKGALAASPSWVLALLRGVLIRPVRTYTRFAPWNAGKLLLYSSIADHLWWLESTVSASTIFGATLKVDAREIVGKHIYYFGVWEPTITAWMRQRLKPGDCFIDVGANLGYYTLLASSIVGNSGKVVAVEALPVTHEKLRRNLNRNGVNNVRTVNTAVWDEPGTLEIFSQSDAPSGVTTVMTEWADQWHLGQKLKIPALPLSQILSEEELRSARMIKIDVEGAEWRVVSEMATWLGQTNEKLEIVIEISRSMLASQHRSFEDVVRLFGDLGFRCYRIRNDYLASSCIGDAGLGPLERLNEWPAESIDQIDLVISRADLSASS